VAFFNFLGTKQYLSHYCNDHGKFVPRESNALTSELCNGTVRTDLRSALSQYFQGNRKDGKEETWSLSVANITSDLHQIHLYHQCLLSTLPYAYGNILPANLFMYENLTELKDVKGISFYAIEVLLL
jgi:hypothetical protein